MVKSCICTIPGMLAWPIAALIVCIPIPLLGQAPAICGTFDGTLASALRCEGHQISIVVTRVPDSSSIEQRLTGIDSLDTETGQPAQRYEVDVQIGSGAASWRSVLLSKEPISCPSKIRVEGKLITIRSHSAPGTKAYERPWIEISKAACL